MRKTEKDMKQNKNMKKKVRTYLCLFKEAD